jgi:hypothetical protein
MNVMKPMDIKDIPSAFGRLGRPPKTISEALSMEDLPLNERLSMAERIQFEQKKMKNLLDFEEQMKAMLEEGEGVFNATPNSNARQKTKIGKSFFDFMQKKPTPPPPRGDYSV